jgi:diaminohydroxyphosphoribosylaminopyrimidine deaminase/5-amino-6-(5-phosphoribosylamino)uracil reductase
MKHIDYMKRCIHLALQGQGWVNPNPMVGAVLVHNDNIISEGYHIAFGKSHAEPEAISKVKNTQLLQESTLYVSLEPCAHFGKTPPCANLIINSKIPRVVIAMRDPNPQVAGKGVQLLKDAGIEVIEGVCQSEARALNPFFIEFHTNKKPYVLAKWAETLNGFIAPLPKKEVFISGADTRIYTHSLRQKVMGVLVGVGTWEIDTPALSDRYHGGPQPIRMVFDPHFKGNYIRAVDGDLQTWVFTELHEETKQNLHIFALPGLENNPNVLMDFLYEKQINSILIEGGATTLENFINAGCVNEIHRFKHRSLLWDNGLKAPDFEGYIPTEIRAFEQSDLTVNAIS